MTLGIIIKISIMNVIHITRNMREHGNYKLIIKNTCIIRCILHNSIETTVINEKV